MMQQTEDGTWVKREGFEPVPNDILFDLNRGDDFARNYPLAWGFRTGKARPLARRFSPTATRGSVKSCRVSVMLTSATSASEKKTCS